MQHYFLKIKTKNEKSLKSFLHFFFKHLKTEFNIIQDSILQKNHQKVITFLKSPHVNKTAQEHFESRTFLIYLQNKSLCLKKNFIFLKKVLDKLFPDISIHIEILAYKQIKNKNQLSNLYPDNFRIFQNKVTHINLVRKNSAALSKQIISKNCSSLTKLLNIINIFGEIKILRLKN